MSTTTFSSAVQLNRTRLLNSGSVNNNKNTKYIGRFIEKRVSLEYTKCSVLFYLGLNVNSATVGTWSDGRAASVMSASQWGAGEPTFSRGKCVGIEIESDGSYGWKMFQCDEILPYICYGKAFESGKMKVPSDDISKDNRGFDHYHN